MISRSFVFLAAIGLSIAVPAYSHKLIEPGYDGTIAKGAFVASPSTTWNRLSQKEGKYQEIWTVDGDALNRVMFFGGVPEGDPLFKERNRKLDPLPKVESGMLLPDIPLLLERSYRVLYGTPKIEIGVQEPASLAGLDAIRFEYTYVSVADEVERRGEAFGAIKEGRLYLVTYEAPALYYFKKDLGAYHQILGGLKLR